MYDAWTRPELLSRWYCPNPDLEITVEADVRVGGEYVVRMGLHVVRGTYTELDGGTRMVLDHTGLENAEDVANHLLGWEGNLQRLPPVL